MQCHPDSTACSFPVARVHLEDAVHRQFRIKNPSSYSSWCSIGPPALPFYNHTVSNPAKTDAPCCQVKDQCSALAVSSLDTQSQAKNLETCHSHNFRQQTLHHVSHKKAMYKKDPREQQEHLPPKTPGASTVSPACFSSIPQMVLAGFCNYLLKCSLQGDESVKSKKVLGSMEKALIVQGGHSCEL
jgi:hypothetical protein